MIDSARRRFLAGGLAAGAIGCAPLANAALAPRELTAAVFAPLVGTTFTAHAIGIADPRRLGLKLAGVEPLDPPHNERASPRSFALTFEVVGSTAVQSTYALAHPVLGGFAALLVPDRHGTKLAAIYNRVS